MQNVILRQSIYLLAYLNDRDDGALLLFIVKQSGKLEFYTRDYSPGGEAGDKVISLVPPVKERAKIKGKIAEKRRDQ
jgi:hypothetical protein